MTQTVLLLWSCSRVRVCDYCMKAIVLEIWILVVPYLFVYKQKRIGGGFFNDGVSTAIFVVSTSSERQSSLLILAEIHCFRHAYTQKYLLFL